MGDAAPPSDPVAPSMSMPRRRDPEFWIAIGALAISALAMLSSVLQFTVQRSQERAAAWPHLALDTSYSSAAFTFVVRNKGMGPALVRHVEVRLDGRPVAGWPGALDALYGKGHPFDWSRISATDVEDDVLAPGERVEMFSIPWNRGDAGDALARQGFSDASRFEVRACYCSVLGDCWTTREGIDHEPVDACPAR